MSSLPCSHLLTDLLLTVFFPADCSLGSSFPRPLWVSWEISHASPLCGFRTKTGKGFLWLAPTPTETDATHRVTIDLGWNSKVSYKYRKWPVLTKHSNCQWKCKLAKKLGFVSAMTHLKSWLPELTLAHLLALKKSNVWFGKIIGPVIFVLVNVKSDTPRNKLLARPLNLLYYDWIWWLIKI